MRLHPPGPGTTGRTLTGERGDGGRVRRRSLLALGAVALAGCSGSDAETPTETGPDDAYRAAFVEAVERDGHAVGELSVDDRVTLTYSPDEPTEEGIGESVDDVARAFFDRVYGGWAVAGLDAGVRVDGDPVATWRMERAWIESYLDGDIGRDELAAKVERSVERRN
jgi:hypothetical protein